MIIGYVTMRPPGRDETTPLLFFFATIPAVWGVPQIQEHFARRKQNGNSWMMRPGEFTSFILPTWVRLFCAFLGTITGSMLEKTFQAFYP